MHLLFFNILYIEIDKKNQKCDKIVIMSVNHWETLIFLINLWWIKITIPLIDHLRLGYFMGLLSSSRNAISDKGFLCLGNDAFSFNFSGSTL